MASVEERVIGFVARWTGVKAKRLVAQTTLFGELGLDGADGWELIEEFGREFEVDLSEFQGGRHFGPEGLSVLTPFAWLFWFFTAVFRGKQTPEQRAGLDPIRISDLVQAAQRGKWEV